MAQIDVHRLHLATVTAPQGHPAPGDIDVFAYLVRHEDGLFLVDTGVGTGNGVIDELYRPHRTPLADALGRVGARIKDVRAVINSHLHFDHCGNNRLFAGIPIYAQAHEVEAAKGKLYTVPEWVAAGDGRYEQISGDCEIAQGVTLLSTPGHTPGHQSVALETDNGLKLIAAQAAYTAAEFNSGGDTKEAHQGLEKAYLDSLRKLKALTPAEVFFSHDATSWTA